jgi:ATP-dependent RNA helicase SUPV3L1/SUV3
MAEGRRRGEREGGQRPPPARGRAENKDRREKPPDPHSPFAKLAALKAQLEASSKER